MTILHQPRPLRTAPRDRVVEDVPAGTFRVHRSVLVDEAVFQGEMESIFERCWLYFGHDSELPEPGSFLTRTVAGRDFIFNRDTRGKVNVFYNLCTHRGGDLPALTNP